MIYLHGLIALLLAAFFASPALAQTSSDTCTEYRVPDLDNMVGGSGGSVVGTGWQLTQKAAYVGSVFTSRNACYESVNTVKDWSAAKGCYIANSASTHNAECPSMGGNSPSAWSSCGSAGFGLQTRPVDKEPEAITLNVGYYLVDQSDASASTDKYFGMLGYKVCRNGRRYVLSADADVQYYVSDNCYTVNGTQQYCLTSATFKATPTCEACAVGDLDPSAKPAIPDTDGDGDPDNTDPDHDGDGKPDAGGGGTDPGTGGTDPGTGGTDPGTGGTDPGTGGTDPGTGGTDPGTGGTDPGTGGTDPGTGGTDPGGGGTTPGDGTGDGQCDPQTQDCSPTGGSFGGDCMAGFTCSGDAIQCAIAKEMHRMNCKLFGDDKDGNSLFNKAKEGTDGFSMDKLREQAEKVTVGSFNQAGFGWGRACPADPTIPLGFAGGAEITIPFSRVCGVLGILSLAGVGITLLGCMVWVLSGTSKS